MFHPSPALAEGATATVPKAKIEADIQAALAERKATLEKLEAAPQVRLMVRKFGAEIVRPAGAGRAAEDYGQGRAGQSLNEDSGQGDVAWDRRPGIAFFHAVADFARDFSARPDYGVWSVHNTLEEHIGRRRACTLVCASPTG